MSQARPPLPDKSCVQRYPSCSAILKRAGGGIRAVLYVSDTRLPMCVYDKRSVASRFRGSRSLSACINDNGLYIKLRFLLLGVCGVSSRSIRRSSSFTPSIVVAPFLAGRGNRPRCFLISRRKGVSQNFLAGDRGMGAGIHV